MRRTPAQVKSDEQWRADALAHAAQIMESHAGHNHYNGVCWIANDGPDVLGRPIVYVSDTTPYTAREHKLAYMLKRMATLKPTPAKRTSRKATTTKKRK